jgi:hypothetical protein
MIYNQGASFHLEVSVTSILFDDWMFLTENVCVVSDAFSYSPGALIYMVPTTLSLTEILATVYLSAVKATVTLPLDVNRET